MNVSTRVAVALLLAAGFAAQVHAVVFNFTSCGATGPAGPDQSACDGAYAGSPTVSVAGGIQTWTVPTTGNYRITAAGAGGASADDDNAGGRGAEVSGVFALTAGQTIKILVGQPGSGQGSGTNGGGGGGSFVVSSADAPMIIGGGGGGTRVDSARDGCRGSTTQFGIQGSGSSDTWSCPVKTSGVGQGGIVSSSSWGSGGGGFNSNGQGDEAPEGGGLSWANGMLGGIGASCGDAADGGFGGGGSGEGCDGGGGGGGYSGGDGGHIAGGAGSFNAGGTPTASTNPSFSGRVTISDDVSLPAGVTIPVPALGDGMLAALMLMLATLAAVALRRRALR